MSKSSADFSIVVAMFKFIMQALFIVLWHLVGKNPPEQYVRLREDYVLFWANLPQESIYKRTCERIYSLPWTTNEEGTMISMPKDTWREWLRELNEVMDSK